MTTYNEDVVVDIPCWIILLSRPLDGALILLYHHV